MQNSRKSICLAIGLLAVSSMACAETTDTVSCKSEPRSFVSRLTLGGYGEAVFSRHFYSDRYQRYTDSASAKGGSHGRFDLPHAVFNIGFDFGRGWKFNSEIEFEHGGVESAVEIEDEESGEYEKEIERGGEVFLEQLWIEKSFMPQLAVRVGMQIIPVGGTNAHHEPNQFFGVYRPEGENTILPCTWHEVGISILGRIGKWSYQAMFLPGLDSERFGSQTWIHDALGYGLLGFHSVEYMLYELSADGRTSNPHSLNYTTEEMEYLVGVARDLRNQCVLLECCWAGDENVSAQKLQILEDAELGYGENYGAEMINAGNAGSRFKTYQEVAEEIIQGCIDIADEVGNTKIGRPHSASSVDDRNYIESPYSLNSIEDFAYNIRSIERSYTGTGSASISDYVKKHNPALDAKLRKAIADAIAAIEAIPEPFALHATEPVAGVAVEVVGTDLVDVLQEVYAFISKN